MGRLRFELRTSRLKAGCSTAELATLDQVIPWRLSRKRHFDHVSIRYGSLALTPPSSG